MTAPVIYRSSDANAPVLMGGGGSLVDVLSGCLVNGYGSAFASGTITNDTVNLADGDTVTIGSIVYTFRSSLTAQPAYTVAVGGSAVVTMANLFNAILNSDPAGVRYTTTTVAHPDVWASLATPAITVTARKGGASGNSIALAKTSTHLTVSSSTLTGGSGTDSKAGAGWTRPFVGTAGQAVFRPPAGCRFYLAVDDTAISQAGIVREAGVFGWETMTAWSTGTGQFPTVPQTGAGGIPVRKSSTADAIVRSWTLIVDDRTLYLFTYTGDAAGLAHGFSFGDFYSLIPGDAYKCLIMAGSSATNGVTTATAFFQHQQVSAGNSLTYHFLPRNYSGAGGSTGFIKCGDGVMSAFSGSSSAVNLIGNLAFPNPADGGLYVAPLRVIDGSTPGTSVSGNMDLRGRLRGMYHVPHALANFSDGDTFSGIGDYVGRTFMIVKGANSGFAAVETTAWDTSA